MHLAFTRGREGGEAGLAGDRGRWGGRDAVNAPSKAAELLKRSVLGAPGDDVRVTVAASAPQSSAASVTASSRILLFLLLRKRSRVAVGGGFEQLNAKLTRDSFAQASPGAEVWTRTFRAMRRGVKRGRDAGVLFVSGGVSRYCVYACMWNMRVRVVLRACICTRSCVRCPILQCLCRAWLCLPCFACACA
jgi:hypothetical protein